MKQLSCLEREPYLCLYINISSQATWSRRIFKALASSFLADLPAPKNAMSLFQNPAKLIPSGWETTTSHVHILGLPWSPAFLLQYKVDFAAPLGSKQWSSLKASYWTWAATKKDAWKQHPHHPGAVCWVVSAKSSQILSILDLKSWNGSQCKSHSTQTSCSRISSDHLTWQRQGCAEDLSENDWPPICAITSPRPRTQVLKVASTKQNFDLTSQTSGCLMFPYIRDLQASKGFLAKKRYHRCWWFWWFPISGKNQIDLSPSVFQG